MILKSLFRIQDQDPRVKKHQLIFLRTSVADPHQFQCGTFDLNTDPDPDPDPRSQTNADPDPDSFQTLKSQKVEVLQA